MNERSLARAARTKTANSALLAAQRTQKGANNTNKGGRMLITDALKMWAAWQERYSLKLGYPAKSIGISSGGINCWDDVSEGVDAWMCEVIDTSVNELSIKHPAQAAAVHHRYCQAVFRFPRMNYGYLLGKALDWLAEDLDRRGVYVQKISVDNIKQMR